MLDFHIRISRKHKNKTHKTHKLLYVYTITFAYEVFLSEQLFNDLNLECGNFIFNVTSFE